MIVCSLSTEYFMYCQKNINICETLICMNLMGISFHFYLRSKGIIFIDIHFVLQNADSINLETNKMDVSLKHKYLCLQRVCYWNKIAVGR